MSDNFQPFRCAECGGLVKLLAAAGERREFRRGVSIEIPSSVLIPKCEKCGETYFSPDDAVRVDAALEKVFLVRQVRVVSRCVGLLKQRHHVSLRDIERACDVTPTYLSHVVSGTKLASLMLLRLLEAYVACPSEFVRHVQGRSRFWSTYMHAPRATSVGEGENFAPAKLTSYDIPGLSAAANSISPIREVA